MTIDRLTPEGVDLLHRFEGLRLKAYDDARPWKDIAPNSEIQGTLTIGYGHTRRVQRGQTITEEEADMLFGEDIMHFEDGVLGMVRDLPHLTQQHFDALVMFGYNLGLKRLRNSTLMEHYQQGNIEAAANEFMRWIYAGGEPLEGLRKRRHAEQQVFLFGDYSSTP